MIGYSMNARTLYHKENPKNNGWSQCGVVSLDIKARDDEEAQMRPLVPGLERCPRCWKGG